MYKSETQHVLEFRPLLRIRIKKLTHYNFLIFHSRLPLATGAHFINFIRIKKLTHCNFLIFQSRLPLATGAHFINIGRTSHKSRIKPRLSQD